jgi:hypothetical protein
MEEKTSRNTDLEIETMQQNELTQAGMLETGILEQVDLSTLQIIHKLFTGPGNGPAFLAQILRFAEVKQMAFPGIEGAADVAVITLQTIRELAKKIHWGYDTTHKYVVVFCALNLLVKSRSEGRIQLLFSLKQYTPPPTSKALDDLISKSRPKVRQFATRIKHRCILYDIIQREETKGEGYSTLEQQLLQQLQSILQAEHIDQARRQRLTMRISSEIFSKLIVPSSIVENLLPPNELSSEQGKTSDNVSSHVVDSLVPDPISKQKTLTHKSTPTQADMVTSGGLLKSGEETRVLLTPLPRGDSSNSKRFESPERETHGYESSSAQAQGKPSEQEHARERGADEPEKNAPPEVAAHLAYLGKLFDRRRSSSSQSKSQSRREQEVPSLSANEHPDDSDSRDSGGDSQVSKLLLAPTEPLAIKSPAEEKSSEQAEQTGDSTQKEVDFSAISQINIVNYSESFLRAYVTLNVIDFINKTYNKDVNVTSRTELAKFLAEIMDNDCGKWKIHMKLLNSCHPDAVAGALIYVFSRIYDRGGDSIRNKAGLFTRHCKDFQEDAVPPNVVLLAKSLKDRTFEQMIAFFKDRQRKVEPERFAQSEQAAQTQQTQQQATSNSVYGLEVPRRHGESLVKQGNRIVRRKINLGRYTTEKRRIAQDG